jgi:hypothetical protein
MTLNLHGIKILRMLSDTLYAFFVIYFMEYGGMVLWYFVYHKTWETSVYERLETFFQV